MIFKRNIDLSRLCFVKYWKTKEKLIFIIKN